MNKEKTNEQGFGTSRDIVIEDPLELYQVQDEPERAVDEEPESQKVFYIIVAVIVLLFGGFVAYQQITDTPTGAVTFEDLHRMNLNGELDPERGYLYNGFSFVWFDGIWYTDLDAGDRINRIPLHFGPREVENVTVFGSLSEEFDIGEDVYITIDPHSEGSNYVALGASELAQNMVTAIQRRPLGACDKNETIMCESRAIVTCETADKPTVYLLNEDVPPSIELSGTCVILRGKDYDLVRAVDRMLLQWLGVM